MIDCQLFGSRARQNYGFCDDLGTCYIMIWTLYAGVALSYGHPCFLVVWIMVALGLPARLVSSLAMTYFISVLPIYAEERKVSSTM